MVVDPKTAAGMSERNGERYYFCSTMCKERFDSDAQGASEQTGLHVESNGAGAQTSCRAADVSVAPEDRAAHGVSAEEAREQSYRKLMRKFLFAAIVSLPLLLLMSAEFIPSWREALMPWHRVIGIVAAIVTLPVLA